MQGDISIHSGSIVGIEPGLRAEREWDAQGKAIVPGFIDAHVHVESSLMLPRYFERSVLERGTTSAVCDPHEIANVIGVRGIEYFLESSSKLAMDLWVMMSSCVPATHLETNGGGEIGAGELLKLGCHERALGLAEVMNVPGVLAGNEAVHAKIRAFSGRPIDGHAPLVTGQTLSAYAAAGITSCHESTRLEEAAEKLRKGIAVWIREGSVAKDLARLIALVTPASSSSIGFCTDDRNPYDIAHEGHLDHLVRKAISAGVAPQVAYRIASWSVARHYGLDRVRPRAQGRVGAIAPGYAADLVVLDDVGSCAVARVMKRGKWIEEIETSSVDAADLKGTMKAFVPEVQSLKGPEGRVRVIVIHEGKIITGSEVSGHDHPGISRLTVLERHGKGLPPANAYVRGFGDQFSGAIASSVGHDSHNLIVVGKKTEDMRTALAAVIECGGGFAVAGGGRVLERLELPYGGLMSESTPDELARKLGKLKAASRSVGCVLGEPFLQLAFLSLPVIPSLKLTDRGLVDVNRFEFVSVSV